MTTSRTVMGSRCAGCRQVIRRLPNPPGTTSSTQARWRAELRTSMRGAVVPSPKGSPGRSRKRLPSVTMGNTLPSGRRSACGCRPSSASARSAEANGDAGQEGVDGVDGVHWLQPNAHGSRAPLCMHAAHPANERAAGSSAHPARRPPRRQGLWTTPAVRPCRTPTSACRSCGPAPRACRPPGSLAGCRRGWGDVRGQAQAVGAACLSPAPP